MRQRAIRRARRAACRAGRAATDAGGSVPHRRAVARASMRSSYVPVGSGSSGSAPARRAQREDGPPRLAAARRSIAIDPARAGRRARRTPGVVPRRRGSALAPPSVVKRASVIDVLSSTGRDAARDPTRIARYTLRGVLAVAERVHARARAREPLDPPRPFALVAEQPRPAASWRPSSPSAQPSPATSAYVP